MKFICCLELSVDTVPRYKLYDLSMLKKLIISVIFVQLANFSLVSDTMTLYRHATFIMEIDNKKILVDPMLASIGEYPPIVLSKNGNRNPLIQLNVELNEIIDVDGVLITHAHNDHFDEVAKEVLDKDIPLLCQPSDYTNIKKLGFSNISVVNNETNWMGLDIERFPGSHGGGLLNFFLGKSSSYLLKYDNKKIYITGDTLLTIKQKRLLKKIKPDTIIAYGGAARLKLLGQITMNNNNIVKIAETLGSSTIIAIHMDSINHCEDSSKELRSLIVEKKLNIFVPESREKIKF